MEEQMKKYLSWVVLIIPALSFANNIPMMDFMRIKKSLNLGSLEKDPASYYAQNKTKVKAAKLIEEDQKLIEEAARDAKLAHPTEQMGEAWKKMLSQDGQNNPEVAVEGKEQEDFFVNMFMGYIKGSSLLKNYSTWFEKALRKIGKVIYDQEIRTEMLDFIKSPNYNTWRGSIMIASLLIIIYVFILGKDGGAGIVGAILNKLYVSFTLIYYNLVVSYFFMPNVLLKLFKILGS